MISGFKKLSLLFNMRDTNGSPIWHSPLDGLVSGLGVSSCDLRVTDSACWRAGAVEDASLRVAYQLRHKGLTRRMIMHTTRSKNTHISFLPH